MLHRAGLGLAWLGRQGTRGLAVLALIGIALPWLGAVLEPLFTASVVILLSISFMRVSAPDLRRHAASPGLAIGATVWTMLLVPALLGGTAVALGIDSASPGLFLGIMLYAFASPMVAAPAFAALMGFDATLVLIALVAGTVTVPLTAPFFAWAFVGGQTMISPLSLGINLFAILFGSAAIAWIARRFVPLAAIERRRDEIDGVNILILFVFVCVATRHVAASFLADPLYVIGIIALTFALAFTVLALTMLAFLRAGRENSFAIGFMASQRNMGLMIAAASGALPDLTWLFFALAQFPIYLAPWMLQPLARRIRSP